MTTTVATACSLLNVEVTMVPETETEKNMRCQLESPSVGAIELTGGESTCEIK
jgi:hypothetical protein